MLTNQYFNEYRTGLLVDLDMALNKLEEKSNFTPEDFDIYITSSAVYSSNIEGNSLDVDTYLKNKKFHIASKPKETSEIDDLISAYNFAIENPLNEDNFFKSHHILSEHILDIPKHRGMLRDQQVGIFSGGKIEYMAVEPEFVEPEFDKFFDNIQVLLSRKLSTQEIFYYAAFIHLVFEKIHPFMDGNGRAGRLLEKWFLASHLGRKAWSILSEKYYNDNRKIYYTNIHIGLNYYSLKWEKCLPFLYMLPQSLNLNSIS